MQRWLLKSKLHRARVTGTEKDYEGSIAIDSELLSAADIAVGERVQVVNVTNGERFETTPSTASPDQGGRRTDRLGDLRAAQVLPVDRSRDPSLDALHPLRRANRRGLR